MRKKENISGVILNVRALLIALSDGVLFLVLSHFINREASSKWIMHTICLYDGGTNVKLNTTQTGREKFSDTSPEAFAPT